MAQGGSLRRAARALGIGQPTVIRHVRQLEQILDTRLFEHTPDGHRLTPAGQNLLPMAQRMADAATDIDRRRMAFADHADPDLDRREADLFVRHGVPSRGHLVRVGLGTMAAAIYGNTSLVQAHPAARSDARWRACAWVAYDAPHEYFGSMAWLMRHLGEHRPRVRASRFALQLEAIRAGAGLGILPCFVGDADPALVRLTAPIAELGADVWLLVHPDLRAVSRVRLLIGWIRSAFKDGRRALQGLCVR